MIPINMLPENENGVSKRLQELTEQKSGNLSSNTKILGLVDPVEGAITAGVAGASVLFGLFPKNEVIKPSVQATIGSNTLLNSQAASWAVPMMADAYIAGSAYSSVAKRMVKDYMKNNFGNDLAKAGEFISKNMVKTRKENTTVFD